MLYTLATYKNTVKCFSERKPGIKSIASLDNMHFYMTVDVLYMLSTSFSNCVTYVFVLCVLTCCGFVCYLCVCHCCV